jgi:regulator of protease activity HflC (stomatin/prohibitin superfamily)
VSRFTTSDGYSTRPTGYGWLAILGACIVGIILFFVVIGGFISLTRTGPTEVALCRNGGPLDSKDIRQVIPPGSTYKVPGLFTDCRKYIAGNEQRFYTITSDPDEGDRPGVDFVQVPTKDGVNVSLEATMYFHTAFTDDTGKVDDPLLRQFDTQYGNRTFDGSKVYDGTEGWEKFLDVIARPVIDNAIREEIGQYNCADLVSSCALIQSQGQVDLTKISGENNTRNFEAVQNAIQTRLAAGVNSALGGDYLNRFQFRLAKVRLPANVQGSIDNAQASFADIAKAQAEQKQSQFEAQRLSNLAQQYAKSPGLATIDAVKAVPSGSTVILNSGGSSGAGVLVQPNK